MYLFYYHSNYKSIIFFNNNLLLVEVVEVIAVVLYAHINWEGSFFVTCLYKGPVF